MGIDKGIIDKLLADYKGPEDLIGDRRFLVRQLRGPHLRTCP